MSMEEELDRLRRFEAGINELVELLADDVDLAVDISHKDRTARMLVIGEAEASCLCVAASSGLDTLAQAYKKTAWYKR